MTDEYRISRPLNAQYFALQKQPGLTAFAELTLRY
jgi:hypothetical protein